MQNMLSDEEVAKLLEASFVQAQNMPIEGNSIRHRNHHRSQNWVKALAQQFRDKYLGAVVYSKDYFGNRGNFGVNELLYDILICSIGEVESAKQHKQLKYIKKALWMVESEFARDTRQGLIDFNKLIIGSADNKLFVGPQVRDNKSYLVPLRQAAAECKGNIYVALIPHPNDWEKSEKPIDIWKFSDGDWLHL